MTHWSEFVAFAVCHAESMRYTKIGLDPMQLMAAVQQAQQQAAQYSQIIGGSTDVSRLLRR